MGWHDGQLVANPNDARATDFLYRANAMAWRSGVKHDVSRVLELREIDGQLFRQDGEPVEIERDQVYPLAKGADVANNRTKCPERRLLVTQHCMSESTAQLPGRLPATDRYLQQNREAFDNRKSSIYRNRDPFALFGIGDYTFAPWKVGICGLYKRLQFTLLGPIKGRAVVVDDTSYTLGFQTKRQAKLVHELLTSAEATSFFHARIFWDAKRPINAQTLRSLDLESLAKHLGRTQQWEEVFPRPTEQGLALVD